MKKIFFAVLMCSIFVFNVKAFTSDLSINRLNYYICNDNEQYPIYSLREYDNNYYFLNMDKDYNFDFRDYSEISFDSAPYYEKVRYFTSYRNWFENLPNYSEYYEPFVSLMIYRNLTGNSDLYLCDKDKNIVEYDNRYEDNYNKILDLISGPSFVGTFNIIPNKDYDLKDINLNEYSISGSNGLDLTRPYGDTLRINGDIGVYEITMRLSNDKELGSLYTDNHDYLLEEGGFNEEVYITTINIDNPTLIINNYSEQDIDYSSLCFNLISQNNEVNHFCANEEGVASVKVPVGIYNLEILSDINNDFSNNHIAVNEFYQSMIINWGDNQTPQEDNNIGFIPSNTLTISGLLLVIITSLGIGFAFKKID